MFIHDSSIPLPELIQRNLQTGRVYQVASGPHKGNVYPSITRVLKSKEDDGIIKWKKRVGEAEAAKISARATLQGTALHLLCERHLANLDLPPIYPHVQVLWNHIRPWLTLNITKVYGQETDIFSDKLGVAGRFDLLADVSAHGLCVVDFKTSTKEKKLEYLTNYFMQGTFYGMALYELTGEKIKRIVLPIIHPEGLQMAEAKPMDYYDPLMKRIEHFYKTFDPDADAVAAASEPEPTPFVACVRCKIGAAVENRQYCSACIAIATKPKSPFQRPTTFKKIA